MTKAQLQTENARLKRFLRKLLLRSDRLSAAGSKLSGDAQKLYNEAKRLIA